MENNPYDVPIEHVGIFNSHGKLPAPAGTRKCPDHAILVPKSDPRFEEQKHTMVFICSLCLGKSFQICI